MSHKFNVDKICAYEVTLKDHGCGGGGGGGGGYTVAANKYLTQREFDYRSQSAHKSSTPGH
jgi:hypothetical protein